MGLLRLLETEYDEAWRALPEHERRPGGGMRLLIGCGVSAAPFLARLMQTHPLTGIEVRVVPVENRFFGPSVTVSGLVTGGDLTERLRDEPGDKVFITECMLRSEGDRFLADRALREAEARLGRRIVPVGRRGEDLLEALRAAREDA